jgi:hypothetical protein
VVAGVTDVLHFDAATCKLPGREAKKERMKALLKYKSRKKKEKKKRQNIA